MPVAPTYGMTEACSQIATFGLPLPGVELRIAPDGEILVRGPIVAPGALAADGWLHTGDLGSSTTTAGWRSSGAQADTIVSGGENVAPAEVEAVLLEHPAVADAAVFGRADAEWGEAVVARLVVAARRGGRRRGPALRHCARAAGAVQGAEGVERAAELPRGADRQAAAARAR